MQACVHTHVLTDVQTAHMCAQLCAHDDAKLLIGFSYENACGVQGGGIYYCLLAFSINSKLLNLDFNTESFFGGAKLLVGLS